MYYKGSSFTYYIIPFVDTGVVNIMMTSTLSTENLESLNSPSKPNGTSPC